MWFKNLRIYQLQSPITLSTEALQQKLQQHSFAPCSRHSPEASGWVAPLEREALLVHGDHQCQLIRLKVEQRVLPASVVREVLQERIEARETAEGHRIFAREKRQMKDELIAELLPKAFTRSSHIRGFWNNSSGLLMIDTRSASSAEKFCQLLRETLGSLKVSPATFEVAPASMLTQWLAERKIPPPFVVADECELRSSDEDAAVVRLQKQPLYADEVLSHIEAGKRVSRLRLSWKDTLTATLAEDGQITRLKFVDALRELDTDYDDHEALLRLAHEFNVMSLEIEAFIAELFAALGGLINVTVADDTAHN